MRSAIRVLDVIPARANGAVHPAKCPGLEQRRDCRYNRLLTVRSGRYPR